MYISRIAVKNYKSYFDASELVFRPGFNVVIGQNSSGKTALLEALSLNFPLVPHRSAKTIPTEGEAQGKSRQSTYRLPYHPRK